MVSQTISLNITPALQAYPNRNSNLLRRLENLRPEVEAELSCHPLILQPIVSISDPETHQRVAALLILKDQDQSTSQNLDLESLRRWLSNDRKLNKYKLPTVLRVLRPGENVPVTASNKPMKGKVRDVFFGEREEIGAGDVEVLDLGVEEGFEERPFDWARVQAG